MSNMAKRVASIVGIVVGIIIIIIGFSLQDTSYYSIGKPISFGADFYTEMYDVTRDVGRAINNAINDLICAIGWLIISVGAIDVCFFGYKLCASVTNNGITDKPTNDSKTSNSSILKKSSYSNGGKTTLVEEDGEYDDVECPNCGKTISILVDETEIVCPWCNAKYSVNW